MSLRTQIQAQIADLQAQLVILNGSPSDTFNLGTVVVFSSGSSPNQKHYFVKTAEETWRSLATDDAVSKPLDEWIFNYKTSNIGYFEVYKLTVDASPIYAS